jgi:Tol biopolymer transport system component
MRANPRKIRILAGAAAAGIALLVSSTPAVAAGETTSRVSVTNAERQSNRDSYQGTISTGGRYIAFSSSASNLVAGDTNGRQDVFVRDRLAGTTRRVSVSSAQAEASSDSTQPSISGNGRYVAFSSDASNLVPGDLSGQADIFVRDLHAGTTRRISLGLGGAEAAGSSYSPEISADGKYVAFASTADNLVLGTTNGYIDVFLCELATGTIWQASAGPIATSDDNSYSPAISANGRYVTYASRTTNLVAGDTNGLADLFSFDRVTGAIQRLSLGAGGAQANGESGLSGSAMSADGRYVSFSSDASNLVSGDTNGVSDIFVRDRVAGVTRRVSVNSAEQQGNADSGFVYRVGISANGRFIIFNSIASNLVAADTNGLFDIFIRDQVAGTTWRVSVTTSGQQGNSSSTDPEISADGRHMTYTSNSANLVPNDTNADADVFARDQAGDLS